MEPRAFWLRRGEEILEKVLDAVDYWCWRVSGSTVEECYSAHMGASLYELARMYTGISGITEEDLELLREMPEDVYEELEARLQRELERALEELSGE